MTDKHYKKFRWFLMPSAWSSVLWFDDSSVQSSADAIKSGVETIFCQHDRMAVPDDRSRAASHHHRLIGATRASYRRSGGDWFDRINRRTGLTVGDGDELACRDGWRCRGDEHASICCRLATMFMRPDISSTTHYCSHFAITLHPLVDRSGRLTSQ